MDGVILASNNPCPTRSDARGPYIIDGMQFSLSEEKDAVSAERQAPVLKATEPIERGAGQIPFPTEDQEDHGCKVVRFISFPSDAVFIV